MDNKIDNNIRAFPDEYGSGMTLRDYFAGQALIGLLSRNTNEIVYEIVHYSEGPLNKLYKPINVIEKNSSIAYQYADVMLKARNVS